MIIGIGNMELPIILELLMGLTVLFTKCLAAPQNWNEDNLLQGGSTTVYNFPFLCTYRFYPSNGNGYSIEQFITCGEAYVLGSCTIYSTNRVLIAVDTVDRLINQTTQFWYQRIPQIAVVAGSDVLDPPDPAGERYVQIRAVRHFYIGTVENVKDRPHIARDPNAFPTTIERNALGELAYDVGVFVLERPWVFNPLVLPIPLPTVDYFRLELEVQYWINELNENPSALDSCSIGAWGHSGNNEIMVHDLVYIPWDNCRESICTHYPGTCLEYPKLGISPHHICFKSRGYADVCVYDQGAPVYCPWFNKGIFAILVKSFDCGLENMPAVYTVISYAAQLNKLIGKDQLDRIEPRPNFLDPRYVLPHTFPLPPC